MNKNNDKLKMIDLFAGAGGLTYGFYKNEFNPIETIEFWEPATKTYNINFKTDVKPLDITDDNVRNHLYNKWRNLTDIVIGGFPCQGFSMAGKRDKEDPRNQLYKYTIDVIDKVQPKCFCLENVKGILSFKEIDGVKVIEKIKKRLEDIGYYSKYILLDASNFGVPQKRERVIFVGAKLKDKDKVNKIIDALSNYKEKIVTVRDAIYDLKDKDEDKVFSHIFTKHSPEMIDKIRNTEIGKSAMKNFSDAWRKLDYEKPSFTVKENHGGVHLHPELPRVLTPRELARLQSFPDDFLFYGNKSEILKQIGNAVPCKLSLEIAKIVKKHFF
ncbi:DNA cytosine methyltransferase [Mycoplasma anserisalpingitidis]|uniref:Cytosine-specific methyltransferase n=1 Tax=Mycoplasma anserisalpingitidis TaxID=519450 RepID=A0A5B8JGJ9_9MOLU|nr:DNA cytosine methyltransferase [Mycoplasma anserisalpingitidis]QDY88353.1 DNA cytosine methyltransferase [Mycoplasma anserisalpingitidis]